MMQKPEFMDGPRGGKLAFHRVMNAKRRRSSPDEQALPGVVFLGGLASDMTGTKAVFLEDWARASGRDFLRFDYSGHGASDEKFTDGCIGDWAEDAAAVIAQQTRGPQILVGSSMGGWIACLLAKRIAARIAGLVGIAAAPDFTEDSMWAWMDDHQKETLEREGVVYLPSDYGDPYPITKRLITDGRAQLVLRDPLPFPFPVRLLHGTADADVSADVALRLLGHARCDDMHLTLVKDADHRFSDGRCLSLITAAIEAVTAAGSAVQK